MQGRSCEVAGRRIRNAESHAAVWMFSADGTQLCNGGGGSVSVDGRVIFAYGKSIWGLHVADTDKGG